MAQFDLYANPIRVGRQSYPLVVVLQSDLTDAGPERIVAPLVRRKAFASVAGRLAPANTGVYATSKAGLCAMSHAMAMELAAHKIRVNAVLPGIIETARMDDLGRGEVWQEFIDSRIPLGVPGNGMEIAYMCAFLCSDMGSWITGQDLAVDGGTSWH